ncbi:MAG: carboxyl transferase domain-containing protein, partial [Paracoccaceae bacterium]|nr:carboxyl transferase domain-containing protein [Paracoccaceae bacterium]
MKHKSNVITSSEDFAANRHSQLAALSTVQEAVQMAELGGGEVARERHLSRGKLLPRDRVAHLLDPGSPFLEIGVTAAHGMYEGAAPSAGVIAGVGQVNGIDCM